MYYIYILQSSKTNRLYTGSTNDLRKRLKQHNEGKSYWTKRYIPWKIIYYEACQNEQDARAREKYLKTGGGERFIKQRIGRFLSLM
ncbi:MAG: GIY-YIG nuclease family protein [Candidatus Campbellbacteria bacterium]|nr:GIY-YIG nuclease family protein [Candidatus Campbellbacteria bacterium]